MAKRTPMPVFDRDTLIEEKSAQLDALLTLMCGAAFDAYRSLGECSQQNLIWLAAALARDISRAASREVRHV